MILPLLILHLVLGMPDWFDWEVVLVLAMAAAGLATMWRDWKVDRDHTATQLEISERLATIEAAIGSMNQHTIAERVASLEATTEAIAALDIAALGNRVTVIETRIDYQPVRVAVRRRDGKFGTDKQPEVSPP